MNAEHSNFFINENYFDSVSSTPEIEFQAYAPTGSSQIDIYVNQENS